MCDVGGTWDTKAAVYIRKTVMAGKNFHINHFSK